ncbi:ZntA, Cation transport ATPase [Pyrenophora tritici-repentis]|uniref:E1-E2 ATPase n=1 Tax=Pyrenophora tritici-repentis TaxID=45151 RepID=A0A2W1H963_9PLEO|nr:E1-E2 ATPase [Pyrenophora tritici-repentis]KAI1688713.1 E1-E2 ATPase [Pyrenophora tritici-repentis]PZD45016.1 ZntA, Cation transport ATPase [Pyrenophora tritici-repentis]
MAGLVILRKRLLQIMSMDEDSPLKCLGDLVAGSSNDDPELGPPNFERVVLRIDGFKCGCCEGGLSRIIGRIPAIRNHQVNPVLARVELDLDTNRCSVSDIIKKLEMSTGYHFERQVASDGQVLEFIISDPRRLNCADQIPGVLRIEAPERASWRPLQLLSGRSRTIPRQSPASETHTTIGIDHDEPFAEQGKRGIAKIRIPPTKIHYDAAQIGARTVYQHYKRYDPDLELAPLSTDPAAKAGAKQTKRALMWFIPACVLTIPVLVFAWTPIMNYTPPTLSFTALVQFTAVTNNNSYAHASLALASLVQLIAFKEFVPSAFRSLYHSRVLEMDFLVAISTTIAYVYSVLSYALRRRGSTMQTQSFFEASTLLVTLILLGRVINEFARFRAAKSVSFRSLQIDEALVVEDPGHLYATWANVKTTRIDARLLQYGDVFTVPPHTRIVTDGIVLYGGSNVDESMITGEFEPRAKGLESEVFAGTNNGEGLLVVRLTRLPHENSVHEIAAMVEDAVLTKPKAQALADRIASWFVPAIAILGLTVFLTWMLVGVYIKHKPWGNAALKAIPYAIATLIVSCPCAIGLAVPMVILIAGGVAARHGIIFRDPQKLEIARNVTDVIFDKTGTVTCAKLEVIGIPKYRAVDNSRTKGLLMCLLKDIKHPVSEGIRRHLERDMLFNQDFGSLPVSDIISIPGEGVKGICVDTGAEIRVGNAGWLNINETGREVNTACHCTIGGDLRVSFELMDRTRPGAEMVIKELHARGIQVHLLSGDNESAVADMAGALYIQRQNTKAGCKPQGKMNYIKDLQDRGKVVMFVGDGTNDSVALKQANVGVHVNQGSDIAKSAADVVLMTTRLHDILLLLDISKAAYRRIVINFVWSALYNLFAISLAAGVFVVLGSSFRISPQYAGLGELISVLPVVLIACQMRWRNYGHKYRAIENDYQKVEAPKRERRLRSQTGSSTDSAGCCEVSATTLARIDAMTRRSN